MKLNNIELRVWEKAPYCNCGYEYCSINNHRLCGICGEAIMKGSHESVTSQRNSWYAWNIDHKIPISRGGTDNINNLHAVHIRCNREKSNNC